MGSPQTTEKEEEVPPSAARWAALCLLKPRKAEPHSFREKVFRKKPPVCAVCKVTIDGTGVSCRVCKVATHRKCEPKVTSSCQALPPAELRRNTAPVRRIEHLGSTKSLNHSKQRNTLPRSFSLDPLMERRWDLDLTYVTERILAAAFPARPDEQRHRGHLRELAHVLQSKHRDKYLLFNLSEKRHDLTRLNPKVQDFGWPELHAPPLDKLCSICKAMETWLSADAQHVVVLYCKGSKGKLGVIVSAYVQTGGAGTPKEAENGEMEPGAQGCHGGLPCSLQGAKLGLGSAAALQARGTEILPALALAAEGWMGGGRGRGRSST